MLLVHRLVELQMKSGLLDKRHLSCLCRESNNESSAVKSVD
jgi:hypothetical protein